jgi:hypothetical protein
VHDVANTINIYYWKRGDSNTVPGAVKYPQVRNFSFTDSVDAAHISRGLAFDGRYLWTITDPKTTHPTAAAKLIQIDPVAGTEVRVVGSGIGTGQYPKDIVYNGRNFYLLTTTISFGTKYHILEINRNGSLVRTIVANIIGSAPYLGHRGIAFDGRFIYLSRQDADFGAFGLGAIEKYDAITGSRISSTDHTILGEEGVGIVHIGWQLVTLNDGNYVIVPAGQTLLFNEFVPPPGTTSDDWIHVSTRVPDPNARPAGMEEAITFDGTHLIGMAVT